MDDARIEKICDGSTDPNCEVYIKQAISEEREAIADWLVTTKPFINDIPLDKETLRWVAKQLRDKQ